MRPPHLDKILNKLDWLCCDRIWRTGFRYPGTDKYDANVMMHMMAYCSWLPGLLVSEDPTCGQV